MNTFLENNKVIRAAAAAAAAQTDVTSDVVDTLGFDRLTFLALLGEVTAGGVATMKLYMGDDPTGAQNDVVSETVESDTSDGMLAIEFHRPLGRYAHVVVERADENIAVDGIVCVLSDAKEAPVSADDSLDDSLSLTAADL